MTKVTSALATYDVTTNREDLTDAVYRITPADTPFISAVPRAKATAVLHEWSLQTLASINSTNARMEGDALTRATSSPPSRKQNYCQISSKDATVSGTQRAVNPAGIDDMLAYQMSLKCLELKRDMENILLGNTGQNAGNTTTARTLRSFNAWISANGSRGTTSGLDSTGATYAATDGTAGDLLPRERCGRWHLRRDRDLDPDTADVRVHLLRELLPEVRDDRPDDHIGFADSGHSITGTGTPSPRSSRRNSRFCTTSDDCARTGTSSWAASIWSNAARLSRLIPSVSSAYATFRRRRKERASAPAACPATASRPSMKFHSPRAQPQSRWTPA